MAVSDTNKKALHYIEVRAFTQAIITWVKGFGRLI